MRLRPRPSRGSTGAARSPPATGCTPVMRTALKALVEPARDPRPVVQRIADRAWSRARRVPRSCCHGLMHTVGREYARAARLQLATLMDYLPRSNDPGCSAGFAHGLVTGVAGQIDPARPRAMRRDLRPRRRRATSATAASTASGTPSCGSTASSSRPRCALCRELGQGQAPDCAQGAFHDYWFSVTAIDEREARVATPVTDPRKLCGAQAAEFVRPCWYRAFVDEPARPGSVIDRATDLDVLCCEPRGPSARRHASPARVGDRPGRPGRAARALRRLPRPRRGELHPRHEGAEPARLVDGEVRRRDPELRPLPRRDADAPATSGSGRRSRS